jgi:organic hydroperoxide reductase OsmC/OhrA
LRTGERIMLIEAHLDNSRDTHVVSLRTNGVAQSLPVPGRPDARGSGVNGGELLCLALATCYCNDVYREAGKFGIDVVRVEALAQAEFGAPGEAAKRVGYRATVQARAPQPTIRELMLHTDRVAEIQATLRQGMEVVMDDAVAITVA